MQAASDTEGLGARPRHHALIFTFAAEALLLAGYYLAPHAFGQPAGADQTEEVLSALQLIIAGALSALMLWSVFEKADVSPWWSIVPVLNLVGLSKVAGRPWWWPFPFFIPPAVVAGIAAAASLGPAPQYQPDNPYAGMSQAIGVLLLILFGMIVFAIMTIILWVGLVRRISRNFGHTGSFAAGLFFLPMVFYPILGHNDDRWNDATIADASWG